jgi:hypothetical protein
MMKDIARNVARGVRTMLGHPGVVIPMILLPSLVLGFADTAVFNWLGITQNAEDANMQIVKVGLGWQATALINEIFFGPIFVATAIYLGRGQGPANLYSALNFALNRYSRLFKWHAAAVLLISVGSIVILPGVLYTLNYAFVDSICCIEDERWPLSRSTKLTRGRRQRIFFLFLPYFVYEQISMIGYLKLVKIGWYYVSAMHFATYSVVFLYAVVMYVMYEERTAQKTTPALPGGPGMRPAPIAEHADSTTR